VTVDDGGQLGGRPPPAQRVEAPAHEEITAHITGPQHAWARELALAMAGLNCTVSDVIRLALDELRDRHPSAKKLEAALRQHVWRERETNGGHVHPPRLPVRRPPSPRSRVLPRVDTQPLVEKRDSIRVLIVDDHPTVRAGLASVLAGEDDIEVVGELGDGQAAVSFARRKRPHVVLIDLSISGMDGVTAAGAIAATRPEVNVVVLSTVADRERVLAAVGAGAVGYLAKDASPDELVRGIRAAARGESAGTLRAALALVPDPSGRTSQASPLTRREREVLALVGGGLANKQIARRLGISEKTVKTHLGRAFQRIGVGDRTQAALWAERNGLLESPRLKPDG
jgi:DNA-binding NarL/FixJ family response regulator